MERAKKIRSIISGSIIFLVLPSLIAALVFLPSKYYAAITVVFALFCLVPFILSIENKTFGAARIVPVAVMTAIAVAGRAAFFFIPQFKPILAVVIITGVAFNKESGFLCGALSMLCSNFIFGQGPWTPIQMLALGLIGYISAYLGKTKITKSPVFLCVWGFMCGILYGFFVDTWTILSIGSGLQFKDAAALYLLGLPFSLVLAAATAIFLALISKPLITKIGRIKMKYGS